MDVTANVGANPFSPFPEAYPFRGERKPREHFD